MSLKISAMFLLREYKKIKREVLKDTQIINKMASHLIDKLLSYAIKTKDKELILALISTSHHETSIIAIKYLINNCYNYLVNEYKKEYKVRRKINFYLENFFSFFTDDLIQVNDDFFLTKRIYSFVKITDEAKLERLKDFLTDTNKSFEPFYNIMILYRNSNRKVPEDVVSKALVFGYDKYKDSIFTAGKTIIKCTCNKNNIAELDKILNYIARFKYQNNFYFDDYLDYISTLPASDLKHEILKKLLLLRVNDNKRLYALCLELIKFHDFKTISLIINNLDIDQKENIFVAALNEEDVENVNSIIKYIPEEMQEKYNLLALKEGNINRALVLAVTTDTITTYKLIDQLININDWINIYLICNTKKRFNSYVIDKIFNTNTHEYIIHLLNQMYLLSSVGFIYLIKFIIDYKYLKQFKADEQDIINAYYKEKEDLVLTLKK